MLDYLAWGLWLCVAQLSRFAFGMDIRIEKLGSHAIDRFKELLYLFEEVFETEGFILPDDGYLRQLMGRDTFFVFVAMVDGKVVGGMTSYIFHQYLAPVPLVYIYDLAVRVAFQRQGVARRLMEWHHVYCKSIGAKVVMVQAHAEDVHAVAFYRSTGVTGEEVVHFEYDLDAMGA
jgi:aminoglycoside 3-N-acetyltransferase I